MDWRQLPGVVTAVVAIVGVWVALVNYRRSVRTRRAEWLVSLHEQFLESDRYRNIRRVLDYRDQDPATYEAFAATVRAGTHSSLIDEFYRYLNFFELLASLRALGQISQDEIDALFQYDLQMIARQDFIQEILPHQGFERLPTLLASRK